MCCIYCAPIILFFNGRKSWLFKGALTARAVFEEKSVFLAL